MGLSTGDNVPGCLVELASPISWLWLLCAWVDTKVEVSFLGLNDKGGDLWAEKYLRAGGW